MVNSIVRIVLYIQIKRQDRVASEKKMSRPENIFQFLNQIKIHWSLPYNVFTKAQMNVNGFKFSTNYVVFYILIFSVHLLLS